MDAFSEMVIKTSPGRERLPASPTPVSGSTLIKTYQYGKEIEVSSDSESDSDSSLPSRVALPTLKDQVYPKYNPSTALQKGLREYPGSYPRVRNH